MSRPAAFSLLLWAQVGEGLLPPPTDPQPPPAAAGSPQLPPLAPPPSPALTPSPAPPHIPPSTPSSAALPPAPEQPHPSPLPHGPPPPLDPTPSSLLPRPPTQRPPPPLPPFLLTPPIRPPPATLSPMPPSAPPHPPGANPPLPMASPSPSLPISLPFTPSPELQPPRSHTPPFLLPIPRSTHYKLPTLLVLDASALNAGSTSLCETEGGPLNQGGAATICIGFAPAESGGFGSKAIFSTIVDDFSSFSVTSLAPLLDGGDWADIEPFSRLWVGARGQRTVGQREGRVAFGEGGSKLCIARITDEVAHDGGPSASSTTVSLSAVNMTDEVCYGWQKHEKPLVAYGGGMLTAGLTAIIHLDRGEVKRIVWDDGCWLCDPGSNNVHAFSCLPDNTTNVCSNDGVPGACTDCYLSLADNCSGSVGGAPGTQLSCAPTIHIAWIGTDGRGRPMRSAGKVFSRFRAYNVQASIENIYGSIVTTFNHLTGARSADASPSSKQLAASANSPER